MSFQDTLNQAKQTKEQKTNNNKKNTKIATILKKTKAKVLKFVLLNLKENPKLLRISTMMFPKGPNGIHLHL